MWRLPLPAILTLLLLCVSARLTAQTPQEDLWRYDTIDAIVGFDRPSALNPQVSWDPWGVRHHTWVSRDPTSAGLQVYHADDATGRVGAPFLLSDTGTVYDSLGIDTTSYLSLIDAQGHLHTLFLANVPESGGLEIGLYYVNNREPDLEKNPPVRLTTESGRYALAVDSLGRAHAIWLRPVAGGIEVRSWNTRLPAGASIPIDTVPSLSFPARIAAPVLQAGLAELHYFLRNDSGVLFHGRYAFDGSATSLERIDELPVYGAATGGAPWNLLKPVDFRLRGALDRDGTWHLAVPVRGEDLLLRLYYLSNASGGVQADIVSQVDSTLLGFDIRSSGTGRIGLVWTQFRGRFSQEIPKTGFVEFERSARAVWREASRIPDFDLVVPNPVREWRIATALDLDGDRVVVAITRRATSVPGAVQGVGYYLRRSPIPRVRSILPDVAAPGMSLVVEIYGDYGAHRLFGTDTLDPAGVRVETVDPADAARLVVGPSVVSWDGRLLSTMLFVDPAATPGSVELRVNVRGERSEPFIFTIVEPQRLGERGDGILEGGGVLGSGGIFGERSPAGVIVVDSLTLRNGTYTIATADSDPVRLGNQGMLPVTILARGSICIDSTASLTLSAPAPFIPREFGTAGPGGGGGGGGLTEAGSGGFTGGGLPGHALDTSVAPGSGSLTSSMTGGGGSHIGTPGGTGRAGVPGGGGTGHPFGISGRYGRIAPLYPLRQDGAGVGGGGGGVLTETGYATGGGGGGHATAGEHGNPTTRNGGAVAGSRVLVPIAGGSGGGGGFSERGHAAGGGGGGALALYAERSLQLFGTIEAEGADGHTGQVSLYASGGGGGSGGGVLIGAQGGIVLGGAGAISVRGGLGSPDHGPRGEAGGDGGTGRVRVDGRVDLLDSTVLLDRLSSGYFALATDMSGSFQVGDSVEISGSGTPGRLIRLYARRAIGAWSYGNPQETRVDSIGVWRKRIAAPGTGRLYVAALERVASQEDPTAEDGAPSWIMSTAGGLIVGTPDAEVDVRNIDFGCVDFGACDTARVFITNTGTQSDLLIRNPEIVGGNGWFQIGEFSPLRIPPGTTGSILLRFCPADSGARTAFLRFTSNLRPDSIHVVDLAGCGRAGELRVPTTEFDLGSLCPGDCRDTIVTLQNVGRAPLEVTRLTSLDAGFGVQVVSPTLPLTIPPNQSANLRLRLCLRSGVGPYTVTLQSTTPFASSSIRFRADNLGPRFELPEAISVLQRDRGKADTCPVGRVTLRNRRGDLPMEIDRLLPGASSSFDVLSPPAGTVVPPLGEVELIIRFCGEAVGEYLDTLDLRLLTGACLLDTTLHLRGRVLHSLPQLSLDVTEKIDFGRVALARPSAPHRVVISNTGAGWGRGIAYRIEGIAPTGSGEFIVSADFLQPEDLRGNSRFLLDVSALPAAIGLRNARLIVHDATEGWIDTVELCVEGIEPGVVSDTTYLRFPDVRRGGTVTRELRFFNLGTGADRLDAIRLVDSTLFRLVGMKYQGNPVTLPITLRPGLDTLVVTLEFRADLLGARADTLYGFTREGTELRVLLSALSGLEQAVVDRNPVRFLCDSTGGSEEVVRITNNGTWPLRVTRLWIEGDDAADFRVLDAPGPDLIDPGGSRSYRVAWTGGEKPSSALLRVEQSGPDVVTVRLEAEACSPEIVEIFFEIPEMSGTINTPTVIPVRLRTPVPLPEEMRLNLLVQFDSRTLLPLGENPARGVGARGVEGEEESPGELVIEATVPAGTRSGTVLEIDVNVLLGAQYRTPLDLEILPSTIPARYAVGIENGTFTTLDCDTTGGIDLGGSYGLRQSVPNPGGEKVRIGFEIARSEEVRIVLYNAHGDLERLLLEERLEAGEHEITVDIATLSSGLYYYEITSGRYRHVRRLLIHN